MAESNENVKETTRTSRETESREKKARRKPWSPPSALDAPEPPEGYHHRWISSESGLEILVAISIIWLLALRLGMHL